MPKQKKFIQTAKRGGVVEKNAYEEQKRRLTALLNARTEEDSRASGFDMDEFLNLIQSANIPKGDSTIVSAYDEATAALENNRVDLFVGALRRMLDYAKNYRVGGAIPKEIRDLMKASPKTADILRKILMKGGSRDAVFPTPESFYTYWRRKIDPSNRQTESMDYARDVATEFVNALTARGELGFVFPDANDAVEAVTNGVRLADDYQDPHMILDAIHYAIAPLERRGGASTPEEQREKFFTYWLGATNPSNPNVGNTGSAVSMGREFVRQYERLPGPSNYEKQLVRNDINTSIGVTESRDDPQYVIQTIRVKVANDRSNPFTGVGMGKGLKKKV